MIGNSGLIGIFKLHCLRPFVQVPLAQHPGDVFFSCFFRTAFDKLGFSNHSHVRGEEPNWATIDLSCKFQDLLRPWFQEAYAVSTCVNRIHSAWEWSPITKYSGSTAVSALFCWPTLFHCSCQLCPWPSQVAARGCGHRDDHSSSLTGSSRGRLQSELTHLW